MKTRSISPGNAIGRLIVLIALAILAFGSNNVFAQTPVSLNVARQGHTATVLADGRVLVFGGDAAGSTEATAEIVDVAAGTSTNVALNGIAARTGHTATRLADGRVLIAGGSESGVPVSSTFFIDAAGSVSPGPNMASARSGHTAVYFSGTNNVLFIGGDSTGTAEVLDVEAGTSQHTPSNMSTPRSGHSSVLMNDGRVLIVGGDGLNTAEIFDGSAFTPTGNAMTKARSGALLRTLPDGKVQIIGGGGDGSMEVYDSRPEVNTIGAYAHVIPSTDYCASLQTGVKSSQTRAALFGADVNYGSPFDRTGAAIVELGSQALIIGGSNGTAITPIASSDATVTTDKLDYAPGETATIKGTGFGANEAVRIVIHEDPKPSADHIERKLDATTDANGNFTISYQVEDHDLSLRFILNARGASSGINAQTTFTDGNVKVAGGFTGGTNPSSDSFTLTYTRYSGTTSGATCQGTARSGDLPSGQTQTVSSSDFTVPPAGNNSALLTAAPTSANGRVFLNWTDSSLPGNPVVTTSRTWCFAFPGGTDKTYVANYSGGNAAPVANNDSYSTNEDVALTVAAPGVLSNDTDSDPLTASLVAGPSNGTLTLNPNGSFTYTPNANFNGSDSFTYEANDGTADSNVATVSITVTAVNDAPVAVDDTATTNEDTPKTFTQADLKGNDADVDNTQAQLSVTAVSNPTNGTVSLAGGIVTFTPTADFSGAAGFDYTVSDGSLSDVGHVTITVVAVNDAPVCSSASGSTAEDTALNGNLSCNDTEGDSLTYSNVASPAHGTVTVNANGSFTYTPNANYNGPDSFTFKANDGTIDSNIATFSITVTAVNDAPTATNDSHTVAEDNALNIAAPGVLSNDADLDGDSLSAVLDTGVAHGTLSLNANGSFSYTPNANFCGSDSFTYHANDGTANSSAATVSITVTCVNDNPVAQNDSATVNEDSGANAIDVLANDNDGVDEGEMLTITAVTQPLHGAVTFTPTGVSYTPSANYNGSDSFTYTISDGNGGTATASVSVTVNNVNDAPIAVNDSYNAVEDTTLTVAAPGVLGNDTDIDSGDTSTAVLVAGTAHGTLTLNADGSFSYSPAPNYCGDDSFTYNANDGDADSNVATVSITVACINDGPVANDDSAETEEDTAVATDVLTNDTDVDGDTLSISGYTQGTSGTVACAGGSCTYTPNADFNGTDSYTYTVNDGHNGTAIATVTVTVTPINDRPVIDLNGPDVDGEQATQGIDFSAGFTEDAGSISIVFLDQNDEGKSMFVDDIDNDNLSSATVTITNLKDGNAEVLAINTSPLDPNTSQPIQTNIQATYLYGVLTLTGVDTVANYQAVLRTVTYNNTSQNPSTDTRSIQFVLNDGENENNENDPYAFSYVTVTAVNDPPVAGDDSATVTEDSGANAIDVLANDTDADNLSGPANAGLTVTAVTQGANGTVAFTATGVTYTPNANFYGSDSFTYTVCDTASDCDTANVAVTVTNVNDAPVANDDSYSTDEDTALTVPAPGVLSNDTDADNLNGPAFTGLSTTVATGPAHGSLTLNSNGSLTYTPNANFNGGDSFTYTVDDGNGGTDTVTVSITVKPVNDKPTASDGSASTNEDTPSSAIDLSGLVSDVETGDADLSYLVVSGPANGTLSGSPSAPVYTPAVNFNGSDSFTYKVIDRGDPDNCGAVGANCTGQLESDVKMISITVNAVNDAPSFTKGSDQTVNEDSGVQTVNAWATGISAGPANESGQSVDFIVSNDNNPLFSVQPAISDDGTLTYTPAADKYGSATVTVAIKDDGGIANGGDDTSDSQNFTITIVPINDAPVGNADAYSTNEDTALVVPASGVLGNDTDVEGDNLTTQLVTGPAHGTLSLSANGGFTYTPAANYFGSDSFTYKACDDGKSNSPLVADSKCTVNVVVSLTINSVNDAPSNLQLSLSPNSINENASTTLSGSFINVDPGDLHTVTITWGDGSAPETLTIGANTSFTAPHQYRDDNPSGTSSDSYTVNVTVTDDKSVSTQESTSVTVANLAPVVNSANGPAVPQPINSSVSVTATYTDIGTLDSHTCSFNWDDGGTPTTVAGTGGTCTASKPFSTPGVYSVVVTVTDDDTGSASRAIEQTYIVVFDPNGGFVTGGGWIMSPAGACQLTPACATQTGKANFGFVSKYKKGSNIPEGQTEFQFHAGSLNFNSTSYMEGSLVISGYKAQYKGKGTVNGAPGYEFVLTAYDGQVIGGGGTDKFRMKITKDGVTVYDNRLNPTDGDDIDSVPMEIAGGSIVIHNPAKGGK